MRKQDTLLGLQKVFIESYFYVGCHFRPGVGKSILKRNANKYFIIKKSL